MKSSHSSRQVVDSVGATMAWAQRAPQPRAWERLVVRVRRSALTLLAIAVVAVLWTPVAQAINPQPIQTFFLTLPEDQVRTSLYAITTATGMTMRSVTGVSITADNTIIYYDQWENGYDLDIANPINNYSSPGNLGGTQVWGNGNAADGCAPNTDGATPLTCTNANDVLNSGDVIVLDNLAPLPRNPAAILFDGRDKVGATKTVAVTRSLWGTAPGPVLADAVEVLDTTRWGVSFRLPVGQNLNAASSNMFEYTALFVIASQDATTLTIDADGNGVADVTTTINQGQSYHLNGGLSSNALVTASKPVAVNLITGDIGSSYETRWFNIPSTLQWGSSYYAPVSTSSATYPAAIFAFNPDQSNAITVNYQTAAGVGSFNVGAKGTHRFAMPLNSGAHFWTTSGAPFLAVGTMDSSTTGANQTFDWGYTLIPESWLTTDMAVGWAPGTGGGCTSGTCNGSPVWVTALQPTTIYVKYDGNTSAGPNTAPNGLKYDVAYAVTAFESKRIFDPDKDQTGLRIFTADGTLITGAWGEDPTAASAGNPYLDVGYTVPPLPAVVADKTSGLAVDVNANGLVDPGDTLAFTITVRNAGAVTLFGAVISDTVPVHTTYVTGTTTLDGAPLPDDGATLIPLDEGGIQAGLFLVGDEKQVSFQVKADDFPPLYSTIVNTATVQTEVGTFTPSIAVPVNPGNVTACVLNFTDGAGNAVAVYLENGTATVEVDDDDQNLSAVTVETVTAQVQNPNSGDYETVMLTETGVDTGIFRGNLPASTTGGQTPNDGTLYARLGDTIEASYTDPLFGDACSDSAQIVAPSETKTLYLSDPNQALDRVDPIATGDTTTVSTTLLGGSNIGSITIAGAATTGKANSTASLSFSHSTGSGANRLMLVGISFECSGATCGSSATPTISAVNFAGNALTRVGGAFANGNDTQVDIWRLFNPPANLTGNVTVTLSGATPVVAGAITFAGVDQSQSLTFTGTNGNGGALQVTGIPSAAGELIFSTVSWDGTLTVANISASGTTQWRVRTDADDGANTGQTGAASIKTAVSASETMTATPSTGNWAIGAVSIEPASTTGTTSTVFTQMPTMASDFVMPTGGQITVTAYISVTSGVPVAPLDITATLKYDGVAFATLSSPTVTSLGSGLYRLVWTGGLASATNVLAGQAVSLTVTTTEPALSFYVFFDSSTYPSRIDLPTTTVIQVDALAIYDAPYPGGLLLTGATNGQTVYVRSTVSDPFGWTDITTVTLDITDPNNISTIASLNPAYRVVTTTASATFEYPWVTSVTQGNYTVTLTANEGYEGITDSASTSFNLTYQDLGTPCTLDFIDASGVVTTSYGANAPLYLLCGDLDRNADPATVETVTATVTSSSGDSELLTLTETGANTGVFSGTVPTSTTLGATSEDGTIYAPIGSTLAATYVDTDDPTDICTAVATIRDTAPRLGISKTLLLPTDGIAVLSETVRFDVVVSNPGPTTLVTTPVTDTFPASCLAFQSASVTPTAVTGSQLTWSNIGPITAGGSKTISLFFTAIDACDPATNRVDATARDENNVDVPPVTASAAVVTTQPQLAISKTLIDPPSGVAVVGDTVTFRIAITNTGTTTITALPLTDYYSAACIEVVDTLPTATGAGGGTALWSNLGPLTPTLATQVVVTFQVTGPCTPAVNFAIVDNASDSNGDPTPPVEDSADVTTTAELPELALVKTLVAPATGIAAVGETVTYTVRITNTGPNAMTRLVITDTYDATCMTLTGATGFAPTQTSPGRLLWDTLIPPQPPLLSGQGITLTLVFRADMVAAACMNTATVSGVDQFGQPATPPSSQAPVQITDAADLRVVKQDQPDPVTAGETLTYTIVATNDGPLPATGVVVTDTLPTEVTLVNAAPAQGSGPNPLVWGVGALAAGDSITFTVVVTVDADASGLITNTVAVSGEQRDPTPDNNVADEPTTVNRVADLGIDKTSAPNPHVSGQAITYTIVVTNAGPSAVSAITVTDNLPADVTGASYSASEGAYNSATGAWTGLSLAAGGRITLTIVATVHANQRGDLANTATVATPDATDPNPGNNSDPDLNPQAIGVVEGTVYLDNNGNGLFDAGDTPMPNVTVTITDSQGFTYTVSTDGAGYYAQTVPAGAVAVLADETDLDFLTNSGLTVFNPAANGDSENPGSVTVPINGGGVENAGYLPQPGLAIDKTGLAGPVTIGDILSYTIQVTNTGNITLTDVTVSDPKLGLNQTVGVLGIGASATVTGSYGPVAETDLLTTPILNTAAVTATTPFSTGTPVGPVTDTHSVPVISPPNLVITKDDGRTTVNPGEIVTYTVAVYNIGDITATAVVVTDVLPAYLTYLSDTVGSAPTVTPPYTYTWSLPDLAPGAGFTFTLSAQVAISLPNGVTNLENYVQVRSASPDRDITNNEDNDIDQVTAQPDLTLFKDAFVVSSPVSNSVTITYVLNGGNIGNASATSVTITDNLDSLVRYDSGSAALSVNGQAPTAPAVSGSDPLFFGLPNLAPGDTYVLTYTVTVTDSIPAGTTAIANVAVIGGAEVDSNPNNNTDETALPTQPGVDLYIKKSATPASVQAGDLIQYTLAYGNLGNTTAFTATVEEQLPPNTTFVAGTPGYTPASPTNTVIWSVAPVTPGATGLLTFTVQVSNPLPAGVLQIVNTAVITTPEGDTVPEDNTDSTTTPVTGAPDLVVVKDDGLTEVAAGATVTYTLVYSNVGNRGASGVVITDTLLTNLTFESATPAPSGSPATGVYTWAIDDLLVDGPHTITVVARVNDTAVAGELAANRVLIADDGSNGPDPDPSNNSSTDSDVVVRPYMVIEKQVEGPAYVGGVITYTISYINMGNTVARNVVISDVIPANTTLVNGSITPTAVVTGDVITWFVADSLAVGESGVLRFAVQVDSGAGGDLITAPSLSIEAAAASTSVTSTVLALSRPDCAFDDKCASLVGVWQGPDPVGPADWNSNPRLLAFDDSTWLPPLAAITETYWTAPTNLLAEWVAITTTAQFDPNYTFYRQAFCMPLNAHGFDATLLQANDDIGDIYLNGVYLGQKIGSGAAASFDATPGLQSGINILATRVLNNNHGGHGPSGADQSGLLFNLSAGYDHVHPFLAAPKVVLAGQPLTFTVDKQALGGRQPYSYTLDFGEGSPVDYQLGESFPHTYAAPGVYTATVTARAQYGCTGSDQVVVTVLPADSNLLANRATVGYANDAGIAYDGETGAGIPITPPDLTVVKSDDPDPVAAGANLLYTLAVTNSDAIAHNVVLTDVLPSTVSFLSATAGCAANSGVVTCSLGDLAIGATQAITVLVAVDPGASGTITNTVTVAGDEVDPTPANNSDTEPTTLNQIADLELDKSIDDTTPDVGSDVVFTVVVTNSGPSNTTGVAISDTLPNGYTYVGSSATQGSYNGSSLWTVGSLASGASASLRITATVNASGDYTNYAQVATSDQPDLDSTPGNNSTAEDDDDSVTPTPVPVADLSLDKSIDNATPDVGSQVVFTVVITNSGPSDATGVTVSDTLPSGYTFVGASATTNSYNNATGVWTIGDLPNGASESLTITATVNASGVYTNYAQVATANEFDPDSTPGDNSTTQGDDDSVTPAPVPVADLSLDKSIDDTTPDVGGQVVFTLVINNGGPSDATGVTVSDNLPSGYTFVDSSASAGSYSNGTGIWTIGSLADGASASLTITATVNASGIYTNYAQVATANEFDPDSTPGDNSTTEDDDDRVTPAPRPITDLGIDKTSAPNPHVAGQAITYTIVVTNAGPSAVSAITVTDNLPADISGAVYDESEGAYNSATGAWTGLSLAAGGRITLTIVATVDADQRGDLTNTATVGTPEATDPNPGNNSDPDVNPQLLATVTGVVFEDVNGNGVKDAGEGTVPGATVTITDSQGLTQTVTPDANGLYTATLPTGPATVDVTVPPPYQQTVGTDPDTITVNPGANDAGIDGYVRPALIGGAVYDDLNGNGAQDAGEPGISGVVVSLSNGLTTTTDASGFYTFTVVPGTYTVTESTPAGYLSTGAEPGTVGSTVVDDDTIAVTVLSNQNSLENDFLDALPATIVGTVYDDLNGDGNFDAGDTGIPGVVVTLSNGVTTTTDATGAYTFTVNPGSYTILETDPAGYISTGDVDGANDNTIGVTVTSGEVVTGRDFFDTRFQGIAGGVYEDLNGDGVQDAGEPGIPGVLITLSNGMTTTTDATGAYSFTVTPGVYTITESTPAGYFSTADTDGANDDTIVVTVTSGAGSTGNNFLDAQPGVVEGVVYEDTNGNGQQDAGEPGIPGVDVLVTDSAGVTYTLTTDANGAYSQTVPAGDTDIEIDETTLPAGLTQTEGTNPTTVNVPSGGSANDVDGYQPPAGVVEGVVYEDTNGNGTQDSGEPGIPGVDVLVTDSAGVTYTLTTDANGAYSQTVPAGDTDIEIDETTLPAGLTQTEGTNPTTVNVPSGGSASDVDGFKPAADLSLAKSVDDTTPAVGQNVVFTLLASNGGPSDATGVTVSDNLPSGYTFVGAAATQGSYSNGTGVWTVGSLANGASATLRITATVNAAGVYTNYAQVAASDQPDPDSTPGDNSTTQDDDDSVTPTPTPVADLSLAKSVDDTTPAVGQNVVFTLLASNGGPSGATNVTVSDNLPSGYTFVASSATQGSYSNGTGVWTIGSLANGASATLRITATVNASGVYTNYAQVATSDQPDPDSTPGDNSTTQDDDDSVTPTPTPVADLSLAKSIDDTTPAVGQNVVFTLLASNGGPSGATGVTVQDNLPSGYTFVASSATQGSYSNGTGVWTIGSLANGASATLRITATVNASGVYTNYAQVATSDQPDPDSTPGDNSTTQDDDDSVTPTPTPVADLSLAKSVDDTTPAVGQNVVFTLLASNGGPSGATGVTVQDNLPSGYTFVASSATQGSYSNGTGVWTIGSLANGASATLRITATVNASGVYTNYAQVAMSDQPDPDSTPGDNSTTQDDDDSVTPTPTPVADLSLAKSVDDTTPAVGQNVVFTLLASNGGPSGATNVTVSDNLPSGYTFVASSATQGSYSNGTGVWTIGSLANGASATLRITATVNASGVYTNYAQVATSDQSDPDSTPGDNSTTQDDDDTQPVNPTPVADLELDKSVDDTTPAVGQNVVFTLLASNGGPSDATGVTVQDNLPSGYTFVASSATQGSYSNGTGVWTIGSLANGASATLRITATVNASGVYTNYAQVAASDQPDPDSTPGDNSTTQDDDDSVTPTPTPVADLSLAKSIDDTTPAVGQNVVFTLLASNGGPSDATGVTVSDNLPTGYTFVGASATQGSYSNGTGVWSIGSLANGASATLRITATVNASGVYTNYAQVATSDQSDPDSTPGDNSTTQDDDDSVTPTPTPIADLSLAKSIDDTTPAVGQNVVFTLLASNGGPSGATGVTVQDNLPSGYTFVGAAATQGSYSNGTGVWTVGSLANGASATLRITATVNASGVYTNYAQVATSDQSDPDSTPGDNSTTQDDDDAVTPAPTPVADLSLAKSVDDTTPAVGQNVVFTLLASNGGPSGATGVTVQDNLPSGYTFVASSATQGSYSNGLWTIGSLANGASATLRITATVNASGVYTNYAQVATSDQPDPDSTPGDNSTTEDDDDSVTPAPTPVADLSLAKSVDDTTPAVGQNVVFTLLASNSGPSGATNVTVSDNLPSGYTFVGASATQGSYSNGTGVWTVGSLANGASATLRITATVNASGVYTNYAQVATSDQPDPDSTPGDNSTTQDDDDSVTPTPVAIADLNLDKSVNTTTPAIGANVVFRVLVTNAGPSDATGVTVSDPLPSGYTFVASSATAGSYSSGTGIWTIGALARNASATLSITATVRSTGVYTNYAQIATSNQSDPNSTPGNNSTTEDDDDTQPVTPIFTYDFGDLPSDGAGPLLDYPVLLADNGASHIIVPGIRLGARVDNEADGQPTEGATGDDLAGSDDEDGVLFLTPFTPGSTATIRVTAAITGYLAGWFDWNSNGVLEASERVFADRLLTPGANNLTVAVPAGITPSALYSRFRFTTSQAWADLPTGLAPDGEVEDYVLLSVGGTLWRDNGIGGGTPNNGRLDGTEPRLANVAVQLLDSNGAVIATTTSNAQGDYIFYGVTPGSYTVRVPATQFQAGGPLAGLYSSIGAGDPNADLDQDVDENGIDNNNPAVNGISTAPITLTAGGEPGAAVDGNGVNSNTTIDLSFVKYDLALRKQVASLSETPLVPGLSQVTFRIEVFNQGDVAASNVQVIDYVQPGFTFNAADNAGWTLENGAPVTTIAGPIQPGTTAAVELVLRLNLGTRGQTVANFAEVAADGWFAGADYDSTPDRNNSEQPVKDDVLDENARLRPGIDDEDDHDVASLSVDVFDLALRKSLIFAPSPIAAGHSKLTFALEVFNQGSITATDVMLVDYVPSGLLYDPTDNPNWVQAPSLTPTTVLTTAIGPGQSFVTTLVLRTTPSAANRQVTNAAEIAASDDQIVGNAAPIDADSTMDMNPANDGTVKDDVIAEDGKNVSGNDEDDHDIATVDLPGVAVGGQIWNDANNNGVLDANEQGVAGVTVQLYRAGDTPGVNQPVATVATGADGSYLFAGLDPGQYFLYIPNPPANFPASSTLTDTADNQEDGDDNGIQDNPGGPVTSPVITLTPGEEPISDIDGSDINTDTTIDFGFFSPLALGNRVWHDANDNGILDSGETGIDGVVVQLYRADQTPGVDAPQEQVETTNGGEYRFTNLQPGEYRVYIPNPPDAYPAVSSVFDPEDNGEDNDNNGAQTTVGGPVISPIIALATGSEPTNDGDDANGDMTVDFGFRVASVSLGNLVWHDRNNNGRVDAGEPGIDGVQVQLYRAGQTPGVNAPLAVDVTSDGGIYQFINLTPGQYFVHIPQPPAAYPTSSTPTTTTDNQVDNDDNGIQATTGAPVTSPLITLTSGGEPTVDGDNTIDFGFFVFDLALRKRVASLSSTPLANTGNSVTYAIDVINQGDLPATNVAVIDYIQLGLVYNPADNPTWSTDANPVTIIPGPIPPGGQATVEITLRIADGLAGQTITNFAEILSDNAPPGFDADSTPDGINNELPVKDDVIDENAKLNPTVDDEDDHDIATLAVQAFDLALRKRVAAQSDRFLIQGQSTVTFTIEVFNQGDQPASNITVIDYIQPGFVYEPSANPGWSADANPTTVISGPLNPGQSTAVEIVLRVAPNTAGQRVFNVAEIASDNMPPGSDKDSTPDAFNNDSPVKDDVIDENAKLLPGLDDEDDHDLASVDVGQFDLALRKRLASGQSDVVKEGDNVVFTIEVFNQGDIAARNIQIVDYTPSGFNFVQALNAGWDVSSGRPQFTIAGPLLPGQSRTVTLTLTVGDAAFWQVNGAEIRGAQDNQGLNRIDIDSTYDAINGNDVLVDDVIDDGGVLDEDDHDIARLFVDRVDASLFKRLADGQPVQVRIGDDVRYVIGVRNQSSIPISGVVVVDYIPAGMILSPIDANGWTLINDGRMAMLTLPGPIPVGGVVNVEIVLRVVAALNNEAINRAEIVVIRDEDGNVLPDADSTPDTNPDNDDDGSGDTEDDTDSVSVSVTPPTVIVLDTFALAYQNPGMLIWWTTSLELDTFGFHLYRNTSNNLTTADRVTNKMIFGKGTNGGDYSYFDPTVLPGRIYWYWLVELEVTGKTNVYGPVRSSTIQGYDPLDGANRVFLPMIDR